MAHQKITDYHARYYAWQITHRRAYGDPGRVGPSLFDASVDLNPHQIDAALFALESPLNKGVMLADEVGLGKTIEAALVIGQLWAERRRRLIVVCPAALRRQWANELSEKFALSTQVLDGKTWKQRKAEGIYNPFETPTIHIVSYQFAVNMELQLAKTPWDLVVIDEAHKLRNAHRESHSSGQAIKRAFAGSRKLLLTATPLQNSLIELYGLSTVLDEHLFGDRSTFSRMYMRGDGDIEALRKRMKGFTHRSLRKHVQEYVKYTKRQAVTIPFKPSKQEQQLYDLITGYLSREESYGFPAAQRHLIELVLQKLLASSTTAVIGTLNAIHNRLEKLKDQQMVDNDWLSNLLGSDELNEVFGVEDSAVEPAVTEQASNEPEREIDMGRLRGELAELDQYLVIARSIEVDEKSKALVAALNTGFEKMQANGAPRKAVIFTESRRTQDYLANYLEQNGFANKVAVFNGSNNSSATTGVYQRWLEKHKGSGQITGSPAIDRRSALIDHFRHDAEILLATEAAAEGVNLQFCSLLVNYDLPWNPQRVEQRIGRCHRYGQKFDVVVINFLNQANAADRRVLELLQDKFELFDGLFGASDNILGTIQSGEDIERKIANIYRKCRSTEAIETAFDQLRSELESSINARMQKTEQALLQNFDDAIVEKLRMQKQRAETQLDEISRMFWQLSQHQLSDRATFNDERLSFDLAKPPIDVPSGSYQLMRKGMAAPDHAHVYRLSHPLGEHVLETGRSLNTPLAELQFNLSAHDGKISVLEALKNQSGWLRLSILELESFAVEEHLVFTAKADDGTVVDAEACQRLFGLAEVSQLDGQLSEPPRSFTDECELQSKAELAKALERNAALFATEQDKLERWAEDQTQAAQYELDDTKHKIKAAKRDTRQADSTERQLKAQKALQALEKTLRRKRDAIWQVEDDIEARRDQLIEALEKRMNQNSRSQQLFTLRWSVH